MKPQSRRRGIAVSSVAAAALVLAAGQAAAQTATIAVGAPVTSLDPHFHQLSPNNAVADTVFDMQMARDAGTRAVGVGWGYHAGAELLAAGAEFVAASPAELGDYLLR